MPRTQAPRLRSDVDRAERLAAIRAEASTASSYQRVRTGRRRAAFRIRLAGPSDRGHPLDRTPDTGHRAAETKRILGEALAQLGETAPLAVRNLTFCTEVVSFWLVRGPEEHRIHPGPKGVALRRSR